MKSSAQPKRRSISTSTALPPLPEETEDYNPLVGRPYRGGLYAVTPLELPPHSDTIGVEAGLTQSARISPEVNFQAVINQLIQQRLRTNATPEQVALAPFPLTTEDFIQVQLVTVREGIRHCFWPTKVLASFIAADVMR